MDAHESQGISPKTEMKLDFNSKRRKCTYNKMQLILDERYVDPSPSLIKLILYNIVARMFIFFP